MGLIFLRYLKTHIESFIIFEMSKIYSFSTHVHRYAVWTAARAVQRSFTTTKVIQTAINGSGLASFLEHPLSQQEAFNDWHKTTAQRLIKNFGVENACSYGRAAKIIAIYLKTTWVIRHHEDDPVSAVIHPPIDRILLQNLAGCKEFSGLSSLRKESWTQFTEDQYWKIADLIRQETKSFNWKLEQFWEPAQAENEDY
jgi:hypothetical protein